MTTIGTAAPDWRPGEPSAFERLGPAWVDVWRYLTTTSPDWRTVREVALTPTVARHDLAQGTIRGILQSARRAGLLQVKYASRRGGKTHGEASYRCPPRR